MLLLCQPSFESFLAGELREQGFAVVETGAGRALAEPKFNRPAAYWQDRFCFPQRVWLAPQELRGASVNALAQQIADFFLESLRGEKVEAAWPCVFVGAPQPPGLGRRVSGVEKTFHELLRKKLARVSKLAISDLPRGAGTARGLGVYFADFDHVFVSRDIWSGGQGRMADDALAPSRSYLKIEEAYTAFGHEPRPNESVCDLGAAPGGWSYSAAKRGAHVVAVDNGPLKGGALNHPLIEHRREDAFRFTPSDGEAFDWMFCDLVEEPHHVIKHLIAPWLTQGWCRRFVVNLKFGRTDPLALLREVRAASSPFVLHTATLRVRHLYHDREEFTVMGEWQ